MRDPKTLLEYGEEQERRARLEAMQLSFEADPDGSTPKEVADDDPGNDMDGNYGDI
jgi:hypothetical protein